ncbi:MAG: NFACT family protein, partial [Chloroflexota bacterium]|nr:NFACT family protein [Chloroflexota bacterium]
MNLDALAVGAVCAELRSTILGGRVQHVHLPDEHGLAMEVYAAGQARWLYASAHPQRARLHLVSSRPPRPADEVTPLLLLLRKYVDEGRLEDVQQPELERIVRLRFSKRAPSGETWRTTLVAELMGRQSNLILLEEDGTVMDAAKRITAEQSRSRVVLPQRRYSPPAVPDRLDPRFLQGADLSARAGTAAPGQRLRELLVGTVQACSPLLAREMVYRVHGDCEAKLEREGWDELAVALHETWGAANAGHRAPTAAFDGERVVAYAAYPLRSFPDVRPAPSISLAIERWFAESSPATGPADSLQARKAPLRQGLEAARDRLRAKRYSLQQGLVDEADVVRLRRAGEHLLAFGRDLAPGENRFTVAEDPTPLTVDPALSAVENARHYFSRYAKAKGAAREVPALLAGTEHELRYLDEAVTHLDLAATSDELAALRGEWGEQGYLRAPRPKQGRTEPGAKSKSGRPGKGGSRRQGRQGTDRGRASEPFHRVVIDGFEVLVGRSGKGNDALLSRDRHPADLWLHARGIPGGHVLIRSAGRPVPEPVLRQAAAIAAG